MNSDYLRIRYDPWFGWILRLAFSVVVIALLYTRVDYGRVLQALSSARLQVLLSGLVLFFFIRLIWAFQMSLTLETLRVRYTVPHLLKIILIGSFYSLVLPGNLVAGGTASWYKLARSSGKGIEAAALLLHFRVVNTLTLLGIGLVGTWFDPRWTSIGFRALVAAGFLGCLLLFLPFVSTAAASHAERIGRLWLFWLPANSWLRQKGEALWRVMKSFQSLNGRSTALVLGLSLLSHAFGTLLFHLLAIGTNIRLSVFVSAWLRSLLNIVQFLPISIAGLGVRDVSLVLLLRDYGVPEAQALGLSLALLGMIITGGTLGGVLELCDLLMRFTLGRPDLPRL